MDDNILEVIPGIFGEIQPTGCIISTLTKSSSGCANKRLRLNGEWKTFTFHRLVLKHSLGRQLKPEYFACHTCDVPNCINPHHLRSGSRLENSQYRFKKGSIKDVGNTPVPQPQKQLRGQEIIPGIRVKIQPKCCILTSAKRSDGCAIKATRINGKTKSFYAHRLVSCCAFKLYISFSDRKSSNPLPLSPTPPLPYSPSPLLPLSLSNTTGNLDATQLTYWNTNWDGLLNPVILRVTVATIAVVSILTICGRELPQITPAMP